MHLRPGIIASVLLAATAASAEEPANAPLASSRQELKALQADQATKNRDLPAGKLTENLPYSPAPTPGEMPLQLNSSIKKEKELQKKKEAQKNWLLDGMDKLAPKTTKGGRGSDDSKLTPGEEEEAADSSDPDYMLKLYSERKKNEEAKAEAKQTTAARNDPLAPFLQGWMDNSPSQGKLFTELGRKPESAGGGGTGPVVVSGPIDSNLSQRATGVELAGSSRGAPVSGQSNPYLQGANVLSMNDSGPARNQPVTVANSFPGMAGPPVSAVVNPIPPARPEEKKPPLLRPSDNDKYFPQLKRF